MSELGPVSQAILEYVNRNPWYVEIFRLIHRVSRVTGARHTNNWYLRRLHALAVEGRIDAVVTRNGDEVTIRFRRLPEEED